MNIKLNCQGSEAYKYNLAFIRALLIKSSIDNMTISSEEKNKILESILQYLKNN